MGQKVLKLSLIAVENHGERDQRMQSNHTSTVLGEMLTRCPEVKKSNSGNLGDFYGQKERQNSLACREGVKKITSNLEVGLAR